MNIQLRSLLAGTLMCMGFTPTSFAEVSVQEQIVGPAYEQGESYILSPKGLQLATVHPMGSRFAVTVDGTPPLAAYQQGRLDGLNVKGALTTRRGENSRTNRTVKIKRGPGFATGWFAVPSETRSLP